jgi:hypothetical protein
VLLNDYGSWMQGDKHLSLGNSARLVTLALMNHFLKVRTVLMSEDLDLWLELLESWACIIATTALITSS